MRHIMDVGRGCTLQISNTDVFGGTLTEIGATKNNQLVDVTSFDSNGWRTFLAKPGQKSVDLTVNLFRDDDSGFSDAFSSTDVVLNTVVLTWENGATWSGDFAIESIGGTMPLSEAVTLTVSLKSSGEVTYTAAP